MKEIAYPWVVAVAQHRLATEMFFIVPQLVLDVDELCVKLIFLVLGRLDRKSVV